MAERLPVPPRPEGFPVGVTTNYAKTSVVKTACDKMGEPDMYINHYRRYKALGQDRGWAATLARTHSMYDLFEKYGTRFVEYVTPKEPHKILEHVKRSGRTCKYDELIAWVAEHIVVPWEDIELDSIPDPKAVSLLVKAKRDESGEDKFWADFGRRNQKLADSEKDDKGKIVKEADKRDTAELLREFEKAYAAS